MLMYLCIKYEKNISFLIKKFVFFTTGRIFSRWKLAVYWKILRKLLIFYGYYYLIIVFNTYQAQWLNPA
jgi:hypothetical protein